MNTRRCLKIAERMDALLLPELGQGVDSLRMVAEPLYARDVLLVCDALPGTEGATLAQQFRMAADEKPENQGSAAAPSRPPSAGRRSRLFAASLGARLSSGFSMSNPGAGSSLPPQVEADHVVMAHPPLRRWFSPSRWLQGK